MGTTDTWIEVVCDAGPLIHLDESDLLREVIIQVEQMPAEAP